MNDTDPQLLLAQRAVREQGLCGFPLRGDERDFLCIEKAGHDPAHVVPTTRPTICTVCNDTHVMSLGDQDVPCTHCPTPCELCRQHYKGAGPGAYCTTTPCGCECHLRGWGRASAQAARLAAQALLDTRRAAQAAIEPVTLARQVIDKYGANSPKPSVVLAKALLDGAHARDKLRAQLRDLKEHMLSTDVVARILAEESTDPVDIDLNAKLLAKIIAASSSEVIRLKQELEVAREQTCARHADQVHGREAEELRAGIELILTNTSDMIDAPTPDIHMVLVGMRKSLRFLLDRISARDSLAYLEANDVTKPNKVPT